MSEVSLDQRAAGLRRRLERDCNELAENWLAITGTEEAGRQLRRTEELARSRLGEICVLHGLDPKVHIHRVYGEEVDGELEIRFDMSPELAYLMSPTPE